MRVASVYIVARSPLHSNHHSQFTNKLKETFLSVLMAKGLYIVLVSDAQDEEAFNSSFALMPWAALPFACGRKFYLGIPTYCGVRYIA